VEFPAAALTLLHGGNRKKVLFLDGPHAVELSRESDAYWNLRLLDTLGKGATRHEVRVRAGSFAQTVVQASDGVLAACRAHGWWASDEEKLSRLASALRAELETEEG
jgi:hypothetical protein